MRTSGGINKSQDIHFTFIDNLKIEIKLYHEF